MCTGIAVLEVVADTACTEYSNTISKISNWLSGIGGGYFNRKEKHSTIYTAYSGVLFPFSRDYRSIHTCSPGHTLHITWSSHSCA